LSRDFSGNSGVLFSAAGERDAETIAHRDLCRLYSFSRYARIAKI
jgi:hypothetical protein